MRLIGQFCIREVLGEIVAIPVEDSLQSFSGIVSLNEVGRFLLEKLACDQTAESLTAAVLAEYEVDEATARTDVAEFLATLRDNGLLLE